MAVGCQSSTADYCEIVGAPTIGFLDLRRRLTSITMFLLN